MHQTALKTIVLISFLALFLPMVSAAGVGEGSSGAFTSQNVPDFSSCGMTNATLNPYCPVWDGEHTQPDPFLVYDVRRNIEESRYGISSLQPPSGWRGMPTKGTVKVPVFLVEFPDAPHDPSQTPTDVQAKMFGNGIIGDYPYESLKNYYQRSSYNQLTITGDVYGWYPALHERSYYLSMGSPQGRIALINEILQAYDNQVNFAEYDADHNGKMDALFIKWAGADNGWGNFWWASMSTDSSPITIDGVKPYKYVWSWYSRPDGGAYHPQVDIHETGHLLGLPDYYDYDPSTGPQGGLGGWDMMDYNWGDHNAFSKYLLGWIDPVVISSGTQEIPLPPSGTTASDNAVVIMPGAVPDSFGEFFLVQYRERGSGNDPGAGSPGNAVWIWHVDSTLNSGGWDFQYDNSYTSHKLLRLMEADGREQIETGNGDWDVNDFYRPGQTLGPLTVPNTNTYSGSITNVAVTDIQQGVSSVQLDFSIPSDGGPAADFTGIPLSGPGPLDVTFADTSTGSSITNRRWDFGDGNITDYAGSTNPYHRYTSDGTFTINLTVTNASGSNSRIRTQYVTVTPVPVVPGAHFTANITSGTAPLAVKFTDTSTGTPTTWNWSFRNVTGNNTQVVFSTVQNPVLSFGAGNFSIVVDAANSAGRTISAQNTFINVSGAAHATSMTGVYRPGVGFYLKMDNASSWNPSTDRYLPWDNAAVDLPIAGDWNADGRAETGVYRPGIGFYLKMDNTSSWNPSTDRYLPWDNAAVDRPIAGDWNADGRTETGVYRPGVGFYLKMDNASSWNPSTDRYLPWDNAAVDRPIAGNFV